MSRLVHSLTVDEIKDLTETMGFKGWFGGKKPKIVYKNASDGMSEEILRVSESTREDYQYIHVYYGANQNHYIVIGQNGYVGRPKMGFHSNSREDDCDTELLSAQQKMLALDWFIKHGFDIFLYNNDSKKIKKLVFLDI